MVIKRKEAKVCIAKGKTLNRIAEIYGLKRKFLESDKRLRKRILNFMNIFERR